MNATQLQLSVLLVFLTPSTTVSVIFIIFLTTGCFHNLPEATLHVTLSFGSMAEALLMLSDTKLPHPRTRDKELALVQ